jgi:hypothetical protein
MRDLGSTVAQDNQVWQNFSNAILGFVRTLDGDNQ